MLLLTVYVFMSKINDDDDNAFDLYKLAFALGCPLPRSCFKMSARLNVSAVTSKTCEKKCVGK